MVSSSAGPNVLAASREDEEDRLAYQRHVVGALGRILDLGCTTTRLENDEYQRTAKDMSARSSRSYTLLLWGRHLLCSLNYASRLVPCKYSPSKKHFSFRGEHFSLGL